MVNKTIKRIKEVGKKMEKLKKDIELIELDLTARRKAELGNVVRKRLAELYDGDDLSKLSLGFDQPKKFLQIDGPQPTLAQLTVLAQKLRLQIKITHLEMAPLEMAKETSDANTKNN